MTQSARAYSSPVRRTALSLPHPRNSPQRRGRPAPHRLRSVSGLTPHSRMRTTHARACRCRGRGREAPCTVCPGSLCERKLKDRCRPALSKTSPGPRPERALALERPGCRRPLGARASSTEALATRRRLATCRVPRPPSRRPSAPSSSCTPCNMASIEPSSNSPVHHRTRRVCPDVIIDLCQGLVRHGPCRFYVIDTGIRTIAPLPAARASATLAGAPRERTDIRTPYTPPPRPRDPDRRHPTPTSSSRTRSARAPSTPSPPATPNTPPKSHEATHEAAPRDPPRAVLLPTSRPRLALGPNRRAQPSSRLFATNCSKPLPTEKVRVRVPAPSGA